VEWTGAESRGDKMRYLSHDKSVCRYRYIILGVDTNMALYIFITWCWRHKKVFMQGKHWKNLKG